MIKKSILAGVFIGLAGYVNLVVGGVLGAVLFSLGLVLVCSLEVPLFTGKAGDVFSLVDLFSKVLPGNVLGCILVGGLLSIIADPDIFPVLDSIVVFRSEMSSWEVLVRALFCGVIMDCIVTSFRKQHTYLGILLGVPVFILCGFIHSIADSFYYSLNIFLDYNITPNICIAWILSVIGNYVGCNLRRVLEYDFRDKI